MNPIVFWTHKELQNIVGNLVVFGLKIVLVYVPKSNPHKTLPFDIWQAPKHSISYWTFRGAIGKDNAPKKNSF